jgi:diguanylate cyclase (GGDEF)-like protein
MSIWFRFLIMLIVMAITICVISVTLSYTTYKTSMQNLYADTADKICNIVSTKIDWDKIDYWLTLTQEEAEREPDYAEALELMRVLAREHNLPYLLVFKAQADGEHYVFDASEDMDERWEIGHIYTWEDDDLAPEIVQAMLNGETIIPAYFEVAHMSDAPEILSLLKGFKGSDGETKAYIATCFGLDYLAERQESFLLEFIVIIAAATAVFCMIYGYLARAAMVTPLRHLAESAEEFIRVEIPQAEAILQNGIEDNPDLNIRGSEIELLRGSITRMQISIRDYIDSLNIANKRASTDSLTGLLNRRAFESRVNNILLTGGDDIHAFAILDIDHFKAVNDTYGHRMGDDVLSGLAEILRHAFRSSDLVARIGGDEFAIFCESVGNLQVIERKIDAMLRTWRVNKFVSGGEFFTASVSVGIALAPADGTDYSALFEKADIALYRVKGRGRNGYEFYSRA